MYVAKRTSLFGWPSVPVGAKHDVRGERPIAEHSHDFAEVVVVVSGTAIQRSAAGPLPLQRGTVTMVRPGAWHSTSEARDLEYFNLYLSPELFLSEFDWVMGSEFLTGNLLRGEEIPAILTGGALERAVGWLGQLTAGSGDLRRPALLGLASCILSELDDAAQVFPVYGQDHSAIAKVMAAMSEDVSHPWTVGELAALALLSPSQLHRRFSGHVGRSVVAWLDQLRGEQAAIRLARTDATVAEIGRSVGWVDPSYATRRFRRLYGMSPTEYRRRIR